VNERGLTICKMTEEVGIPCGSNDIALTKDMK
jgi:hypothetical protein